MPKFNIVRDIHVPIPDHQILISFESDEAAVAWDTWWSNEGEQSFLNAYDDYKE